MSIEAALKVLDTELKTIEARRALTAPVNREDLLAAVRRITVPLRLNLNPHQAEVVELIASGRSKRIALAWGRRSGKTTTAAILALAVALAKPHARGWVVGPTHKLAERAFELIWNMVGDLGLKTVYRNWHNKLIKLTNGSVIEGYSAEDNRSLVGASLDWLIIDEASRLDGRVWEVDLRPALIDRNGWALLIGTLEADTWYYNLYREAAAAGQSGEWLVHAAPTWANLAAFPGGERDPRIEAERRALPRDQFLELYGGIIPPARHRVYKEFEDGVHVIDFDYRPDLPVFLGIDPSAAGAHPYAVVACQVVHREELGIPAGPATRIVVIDEFYRAGVMTEDVLAELRLRPWWPLVRQGVIDPAAPDERRRWAQAGVPVTTPPPQRTIFGQRRVLIEPGIALVRRLLRDPETFEELIRPIQIELIDRLGWEDRELSADDQLELYLRAREALTPDQLRQAARLLVSARCQNLIAEFHDYRFRVNRRSGSVNPKERPVDQRNHALDALRYLCWTRFRYGDGPPAPAQTSYLNGPLNGDRAPDNGRPGGQTSYLRPRRSILGLIMPGKVVDWSREEPVLFGREEAGDGEEF